MGRENIYITNDKSTNIIGDPIVLKYMDIAKDLTIFIFKDMIVSTSEITETYNKILKELLKGGNYGNKNISNLE